MKKLLLPVLTLTLVGAGVGLAAPALAAGTPTTTAVTAVTPGPFSLATYTSGGASDVTVSGTSNGTAGGHVDVHCRLGSSQDSDAINNVALAADGSWTATVPSSSFGNRTCRLYAVPTATTPTDLTPFHGIIAGFGSRSTYNGQDGLEGETLELSQASGAAEVRDIDGCAISGQSPLDVDGFGTGQSTWVCANSLVAKNSQGTGQPDSRTSLQVDGHAALLPQDLDSFGTHYAPATSTVAIDPATGALTWHESEVPARCTQPDVYPATSTSCPTATPLGVRLDRTVTSDPGGRDVVFHDTWVSTDGQAHAIDLFTEHQVAGARTTGVDLPWTGSGLAVHSVGDIPGPQPGPTTITVATTTQEPPSSDEPIATITTSIAPVDVLFTNSREFYLHFTRSVPAGGSSRMTASYAVGVTAAEVQAVGDDARDQAAPSLSVDPLPPLSGTKASVVTGKVAAGPLGNSAPRSVSVTGQGSAAVKADGTFAVPVTLKPGPNALQITTTDGDGQDLASSTFTTLVGPLTQTPPKVAATRITHGKKKGQISKDVVTLPLTCATFATSKGCATTVVLLDGKKVLGTKTLALAPGATGSVAFTLPASLLKTVNKLKTGKVHLLTLAASVADPAGGSFTLPTGTASLTK